MFPVDAEPTVELARAAVAAARQHDADVIAAIGGGSVIDTGKAVAMLLGNGGDPLDYLEVVGSGRDITRPAVPCVAVPTTAGTGAEVTANAVLAVPSHRVKASLRSPLMIPRVALVDPLLTVSCPPRIVAIQLVADRRPRMARFQQQHQPRPPCVIRTAAPARRALVEFHTLRFRQYDRVFHEHDHTTFSSVTCH